MTYDKLEGTVGIIEVDIDEFCDCWLKVAMQGYNCDSPHVNVGYISISSPKPYMTGEHYTLVYPQQENNILLDMIELYENYIIYFEQWVRKDERYNIRKLIEEIGND